MKIIGFEIIGLFGRDQKISGKLHSDLNILTGRNGAGKTTVLKLLWYIMSGNILLALHEIIFQKATIETDLYTCAVTRISQNTCKIEFAEAGEEIRIYEDFRDDNDDIFENAEDQVNPILIDSGSSVFFPTFRRIEGGFTLEPVKTVNVPSQLPVRTVRKNAVEEGLVALSRKLTNGSHVFVSAISTVDIVSLLLRQYADLSDAANERQQATTQEVIETIKAFKSDKNDVKQIDAANIVLDTIRSKIEEMEVTRGNIMVPIDAVQKLVEQLFRHTGIKIGTRLSFGDAASAIDSDSLSAGEKQMLSFICYNIFYKNSVIFIDEPELSLHVDWQRQLFSILQRQQSSNQFVVATHSPFIYSKYPEKELTLGSDRGDAEA
jgi:ABC-type cobalamin/Fe3+-siderophores transport system ATPase subunit